MPLPRIAVIVATALIAALPLVCVTITIEASPSPGDAGATGTTTSPAPTTSASGESTVTAAVGATTVVPAPQYEAHFEGVRFLTNAEGQVTYVDPSGSVVLSLTGQGGQAWALVHGQDLSAASFSEVDAVFTQQQAAGQAAGVWDTATWGPGDACGAAGDAGALGPCPTFPIGPFLSTEDDLAEPLDDALLVQNRDAAGVASYEVLTLTFHTAP
jgi:hypothetical protein